MADVNCYVQPGDLIEIHRQLRRHWALYLGDEYVIHVTGGGARSIWGSISSMSDARAKVKKELLKKVLGNDKWRVNNKYDYFRTTRSVEEILRSAEQWIDRVVPYALLGSNCEHFFMVLRYGEGVVNPVSDA
ncbi:HRSL1 enzyme, partial [Alaudala cheleensis]|nr:HRSL1 enzyme [Alaudala cheleensis]